ncbi:MAG: TatD family hydrolase [Desulfobacterium sp.]|nr:TatD family hydrolase [Desulfobacterium sp.]
MNLFDAHCHLQDKGLRQSLSEILEKWSRSNRGYLACCGTAESDWEKVAAIARNNPQVIANFGIHPWKAAHLTDKWEEKLEEWLNRMPSGVGEIGLDFMDKSSDRNRQKEVFLAQLDLANQLARPVSIHILKAWDSFITILKRMAPLPHGGLIHSYSGSADMVPLFESYNLFISFSGAITNPRNKKVAKALKAVSSNRLLVETDSPDQIPIFPGRDLDLNPALDLIQDQVQINTPNNLMVIVKAAANILDLPVKNLAYQTFKNTMVLFNPIIRTS